MITEKTMSDLVGLVEEALDERTYSFFEDRLESANYSNTDRMAFSAMRMRIRRALPVVEKIPLLLEAACAAFAGLSFESLEYHDSGGADAPARSEQALDTVHFVDHVLRSGIREQLLSVDGAEEAHFALELGGGPLGTQGFSSSLHVEHGPHR